MKEIDSRKCSMCSSEVPKEAVVCGHFRSDIEIPWYKKFELFNTFYAILAAYLAYSLGQFKPEFKDYQEDFIIKQVNAIKLPDEHGHQLIFEIENKSNVKCENLSYELVSIQDDVMLEVKNWAYIQLDCSTKFLILLICRQ